jgi:transaldolase
VDAEVDRRIEQLDDSAALELRGLAAIAQAMLAYRLFEEAFSTERWTRLARRGATPQRLAWICTGTGLDSDRTPRYRDALRLPNTIQVISASTVATLNEQGLKAPAPDISTSDATGVVSALAALGIDLDDVATVLERQSTALAQDSLADAVDQISERAVHQ